MSRIGRKPVPILEKTNIDVADGHVTVTGPRGSLAMTVHPDMKVAVDSGNLVVTRPSDLKKHRALHGLTRALIANMVQGVSTGFSRQLQIIGVGYRSELKGKTLILNLGYSHPIVFNPPQGVNITVEAKENKITIEGIDKQMVGQVAAKIRSFRPPEPYKGKGIRYVGEHVQQKAGKAAAK